MCMSLHCLSCTELAADTPEPTHAAVLIEQFSSPGAL